MLRLFKTQNKFSSFRACGSVFTHSRLQLNDLLYYLMHFSCHSHKTIPWTICQQIKATLVQGGVGPGLQNPMCQDTQEQSRNPLWPTLATQKSDGHAAVTDLWKHVIWNILRHSFCCWAFVSSCLYKGLYHKHAALLCPYELFSVPVL